MNDDSLKTSLITFQLWPRPMRFIGTRFFLLRIPLLSPSRMHVAPWATRLESCEIQRQRCRAQGCDVCIPAEKMYEADIVAAPALESDDPSPSPSFPLLRSTRSDANVVSPDAELDAQVMNAIGHVTLSREEEGRPFKYNVTGV